MTCKCADLEPMQKSVIKFFDKVFAAVPAGEPVEC